MIYACGAWWKQPSEILRDGVIFDAFICLHSKSATHESVAAKIITVRSNIVAVADILFLGNSKEQSTGIGAGTVLAEESQMVASNKALPARADVWISIILSQLEGLVHPAVSVTQIR